MTLHNALHIYLANKKCFYSYMDFNQLGTYTLESAGTLVLVIVAYKIYKLRIATESDCCGHALRVKTSNRGDSSHDLEMTGVTVESKVER